MAHEGQTRTHLPVSIQGLLRVVRPPLSVKERRPRDPMKRPTSPFIHGPGAEALSPPTRPVPPDTLRRHMCNLNLEIETGYVFTYTCETLEYSFSGLFCSELVSGFFGVCFVAHASPTARTLLVWVLSLRRHKFPHVSSLLLFRSLDNFSGLVFGPFKGLYF